MTAELRRIVVTTIQAPTMAMGGVAEAAERSEAGLVVVGDRKGPVSFDLPRTQFLSLDAQRQLPFALAQSAPVGHYTRKNIGYLIAISDGASSIYETDDDNAPLPEWRWRGCHVEAEDLQESGWVNVYRCFSDALLWPRGLPLSVLRSTSRPPTRGAVRFAAAPIQQGLANGSPDVDAVWRLVLDMPIAFRQAPSVRLRPGAWCPFNSQSTWWWPEAYPLLYLPSFCSFRMTDIWRSFIAQRCLWELGHGLVFHTAEVFQDRNEHDLMKDFSDEIPGYLGNEKLKTVLESVKLVPGDGNVTENLGRCYHALVAAGFFDAKELELVQAWMNDVDQIRRKLPVAGATEHKVLHDC